MNGASMKPLSWIRGPKSDFVLFVAALALANLVGARAFFRIDLTERKSYSLSEASRRSVATLEDPLSVKVFFTRGLPFPYNGVERYLNDLLVEYKGVGSRRFSFAFFDMEKPENKDLAESYGIAPIQVQEVKNDEVGLKNAYMGLAVVYGDAIETLNGLASTEGLEYRLTTAMEKLRTTADALAGPGGKAKITLYASSSLGAFRIQGFGELDRAVREVFGRVNAAHRGKLEYASADPSGAAELDALSARYGLQKIAWQERNGAESGAGALGIVVEYGDRSRTIPISLARGLFGGYVLTGLDGLEARLSGHLQALLSASPAIGYATGHGERSLSDQRAGAPGLAPLVSDLYELRELDLSGGDIPADLTTIIVNGPRTRFSDAELYKLDQFIVRGGSLLALIDPFDERAPRGGGMPEYVRVETGLEALLEKYGAKLAANYVLDAESYVARQRGAPDTPLYFAPLVGKKGLNRSSPISRNLSDVLFLKAGEVAADAGTAPPGVLATMLVSSSDEAWTLSERIALTPYALSKPDKDKLARRGLAALLSGTFPSAFGAPPAQAAEGGAPAGSSGLRAATHLSKGSQSGRIVVFGTSEISGPALLDGGGAQPAAVLLRNAIDYLAGNEELCDMRTKGLELDPLDKSAPAARAAAKAFNQYGLPLAAAAAGLIAWRMRARKRERIRTFYARPEGDR